VSAPQQPWGEVPGVEGLYGPPEAGAAPAGSSGARRQAEDPLERYAAWTVVRFGAEAAEGNLTAEFASHGESRPQAAARAAVLVGEVSGWPEDRLQAAHRDVEARRLNSIAEQAGRSPVSPSPDGILVDAFASEVLAGRYIWTAVLGWMAWHKPVWERAEDEQIREQVRLWAIRKHRAAYKELNDAMKRGEDEDELKSPGGGAGGRAGLATASPRPGHHRLQATRRRGARPD
jgi:hypothetical protein